MIRVKVKTGVNTMEQRKENRLIKEKSPYLLQHAYNPVDWYPWGDEAFKKAANENKPIFLSIGYSTCHWCHVMERESFEDSEVAEVLNKYFICIKVDREERPDIDSVYMKACQTMTGQGGWPLSIFMTPEKKPFYATTYIPKNNRYGMLGMIDLVKKLNTLWEKEPKQILQFAESLTESVAHLNGLGQSSLPDKKIIDHCFDRLNNSFDNEYSGFGKSPKFPVPQNLMFLMRYYKTNKNKRAIEMVEETLDAMLKGGIYDHVGGGFARYSTDNKWLAPHFEKMLYDNALLTICYAEAFQITNKKIYKTAVEDIINYIKREMTHDEGAFFSAEDADSEGVEGKYYVWTKEEIIDILGDRIGSNFCEAYDITDKGNFEGKNIPNLIDNEQWEQNYYEYIESKRKLLEVRDKRIHPHKDDKILTSWNGLMISACAISGRILNRKGFIDLGIRAYEFIEKNLIENGRLFARFREGERRYLAYADDYSFMLWASLELFESTGDETFVERAKWYGSELIRLFWDRENGGLFFNGNDSEKLLMNPKEAYDNAMPSGNSAAAYNLIRLGRIVDDEIILRYGEKIIKAFGKGLEVYPDGFSFMTSALMLKTSKYIKTVLAGKTDDLVFEKIKSKMQSAYMPFISKTYIYTDTNKDKFKEYKQRNETALYICKDFACHEPIIGEERILQEIHEII